MKAQELRIGNYLKRLDESVFEVNSEDIQIVDRWDSSEDLLPKPIPLTEEWLIKFNMELVDGFSNQRFLRVKKHEYDVSKITFSHTERIVRFSNGDNKGTTLIPHIKYVHQLQNLYFILTGEELTAKEELT